ncbi:MAG: cation-transporting P-type ATPase [Bacteroidales bacterium]
MQYTAQAFKGLIDDEVLANQQKFGINVITPPPRESVWKLYVEKLRTH